MAVRDRAIGDEVVWDYGVRREKEWGRCRLMDGVVVGETAEPGPSGSLAEDKVRRFSMNTTAVANSSH